MNIDKSCSRETQVFVKECSVYMLQIAMYVTTRTSSNKSDRDKLDPECFRHLTNYHICKPNSKLLTRFKNTCIHNLAFKNSGIGKFQHCIINQLDVHHLMKNEHHIYQCAHITRRSVIFDTTFLNINSSTIQSNMQHYELHRAAFIILTRLVYLQFQKTITF